MKHLLIILLGSIAFFSCDQPVKKSKIDIDQKKIDAKPTAESDVKNSSANSTNDKIEGIDISHYQTNVDWNDVKNDNISFVFVKATGGATYIDPSFTQHWNAVKKAGIIRGAYHFYYTKDDPSTQAEFFISNVLSISDKDDLPPVIDIESDGVNTDISVDQLQLDIHDFLSIVEKAFGRKPILYTSHSFAQKYFADPAFDKYYLWLAEYDLAPPNVPTGWSNTGWSFWQNSPSANVKGINGTVDHDLFKGSLAELKSL